MLKASIFWMLTLYATDTNEWLGAFPQHLPSYASCDANRKLQAEPGRTYGVCVPQKAS